jgi:hypothetical protein
MLDGDKNEPYCTAICIEGRLGVITRIALSELTTALNFYSRLRIVGVSEGVVRSETGQKGFFINMATVLLLSGCVVHFPHTFGRSSGRPLCPSRVPRRSKWQNRRIIPE